MSNLLSKSRVMAARQCQRRLWLDTRRPELGTFDAPTKRRFSHGEHVNRVFRGLHPGGTLLGDDMAPQAAVQATREILADKIEAVLFEAAFSARGVLVRVDMLQQTAGGLQLTEVKSSTRLKPHHLIDCAIQHWVISEAGYDVAGFDLAHIDRRFVYRGDRNYAGLLRRVDILERTADMLPAVPDWIERGLDALGLQQEPALGTGPHCTDPLPCPFIAHCTPPGPEYPLRILHGGGRIVGQLASEGINDVRDIPEGRLHKPLHRRIREVSRSGVAVVDPALGGQLESLPYPRYYLDFEGIQFAVPRWPGTRPYEQVPFQWSCHIEPRPGELRHTEFLDASGGPPMRGCAQALIASLGEHGPIFTYSRYEHSVIGRLAARLPDLAPALDDLRGRLVDLLPLVRDHYYHPAMKGSFSIKAVLPTIAPKLNHDRLGAVSDGAAAQAAYDALIAGDPDSDDHRRLETALLDYCRLDTLAMVRIVAFFCRSQSPADDGPTPNR